MGESHWCSYKIINPDTQGSPEEIRLSHKEGVLELTSKNPLVAFGNRKDLPYSHLKGGGHNHRDGSKIRGNDAPDKYRW